MISIRTMVCLASAIFILSCHSKQNAKVAGVDLSIERFDKQIMALESKDELQSFFKKNPWYSKSLYRTFPDDTSFVNHLYYIISHPGSKDFYQEVDSTFGDLSTLKESFSAAFSEIRNYYPDFVPPKIYTTFTGLENDIFVTDSLVIIALEAFVGPNATYRPDQPNYILRRYQKPYIVPSIVRLLANSHIKTSGKSSMLNDMLYFGKGYEFTKTMMPDLPDSLIIGLPDSSLRSNWYAQDLIWAHFIDKKLLYEQNQRVKEKYLGERPKTPEIGPECPGRVGQWLGWRIIDKFRTENTAITFQELMELNDAPEILRLSKYRGQVD